MGTLNNIVTIITQLTAHAMAIGIAVGGLMIAIYATIIMLSHETSAMANRNKWESLQKVIICAGIIAGSGAFIQFAQSLGHML